MKAVVINRYGGPEVLEYVDVDRPRIAEDEILVRVRATSVNPVECAIRSGRLRIFFRLKLPTILGVDVSGEVAEVGAAIKKFKVGDEVYAFIRESRGGAYAEFAAVPATWAGRKPANLSHTEAAAPGVALTALQTLHRVAQLRAGQKALINGGAGGVGTYAIQMARALGAEVTAVCSTPKVELVRRLGAQRVVDYTQEDFTKDRGRYDVILDCVGNHTYLALHRLLRPGGIHITITPRPHHYLFSLFSIFTPGKRSKVFIVEPGKSIDLLTQMIEAGQVKPVIDRVYPLGQMAEAHRYCERGRAAGKIVIAIE
jgi:NADPH:quinone reductase-like Zn-dependent oxidoreductase